MGGLLASDFIPDAARRDGEDLMTLDWNSNGVDWRDESRDPDMVRDWIEEAASPNHPGSLWRGLGGCVRHHPPIPPRRIAVLVRCIRLMHLVGEPMKHR